MRLPNAAHVARPWRIHELVRDFRLEDVWALPTPGGRNDFPRLVQQMASGDPAESSSRAARTLWAIRWKVGEALGWDGPDGATVRSGQRFATGYRLICATAHPGRTSRSRHLPRSICSTTSGPLRS